MPATDDQIACACRQTVFSAFSSWLWQDSETRFALTEAALEKAGAQRLNQLCGPAAIQLLRDIGMPFDSMEETRVAAERLSRLPLDKSLVDYN